LAHKKNQIIFWSEINALEEDKLSVKEELKLKEMVQKENVIIY